jgi:hypothetical protein
MEAMAERSLNGTVELAYAASGVTWAPHLPDRECPGGRQRELNEAGLRYFTMMGLSLRKALIVWPSRFKWACNSSGGVSAIH